MRDKKFQENNFAFQIDDIIHQPARLKIIMQLYVLESADYNFLKRQTGLSWGNIASHMEKLEEAHYVHTEKRLTSYKNNKNKIVEKPQTIIRLTERGRFAFEEYRKYMKSILNYEFMQEDENSD